MGPGKEEVKMHTIRLMLYLICISLLAFGVCGVTPTDDMLINSNTTLTPGMYNINDIGGNGVIIINATSNVMLDCNGAVIIGTGNGYGIVGIGGMNVSQLMDETDNLNNPTIILENMDLFISSITFIENITIKNCTIRNYQNAVNLTAFKNLVLSNNIMSNNINGIYLFMGYGSNLYNNTIYNNTNGIYSISLNTSLSNNTAYNNTGIGIINAGIGSNSSGNNVYGNSLGIASVGFYNKVFGNDVSGNGVSGNIKGGILAFGGNGTEIFNNIASYNNQSGIAMVQTADVKVYNNTADFNDYGISVSGAWQGGTSYLINISNNTASYNSKAGIMLSDFTFEKMLRKIMSGIDDTGHNIVDGYIVGNDLLNEGSAYDLYIDDGTGGHISGNAIRGNSFNGRGVYDGYPQNNDYCNGNYYSASAGVPDAFGINGITMFTSQEGSFLDGTIDVCDLDMDGDVTCGWYSNGGLSELVVNPNCMITSSESMGYFRNGTYLATFFARDPEFVEKMTDVNVTVENVNRAPNITGVVINTAEEAKNLAGIINVYDPDGDLYTCSLVSSTLPEAKVNPTCTIYSDSFLPPSSLVNYNMIVNASDTLLNVSFYSKDFEVQRPPFAPVLIPTTAFYEKIEKQTVKFNVSLNHSLTSNGDPNPEDNVTIFSLNLPRNATFIPINTTLMNFTWKIPCDEVDIGSYTEDPPGSGNTFIIYTIDFQTNDSHGAYGPPTSVNIKIWNNTIC